MTPTDSGPGPGLTPVERRVLGVLVEKALTTPERYPLTLKAVVAGCNQKSNRHPVREHTEAEVDEALSLLAVKGLAALTDTGGRTTHWRHRLEQQLGLGAGEQAVLAELLLRGPQQPGELRARATRMHPLPDRRALQEVLDRLTGKDPPLLVRLGPGAGGRSERFADTLGPGDELPSRVAAPHAAEEEERQLLARLEALEHRVEEIRRALARLGWDSPGRGAGAGSDG